MDLGMMKWILAGLIECDSVTNLSSLGSWAVSPALKGSFPPPTPISCATQMHFACVPSCAKGQEVLPPGQRQCCSWLFRGEMHLSGADKRRVVWPVSLPVKITWWSVASRLTGVFCNSVSCGELGHAEHTSPLCLEAQQLFCSSSCCIFFCLFFLFPPTAY